MEIPREKAYARPEKAPTVPNGQNTLFLRTKASRLGRIVTAKEATPSLTGQAAGTVVRDGERPFDTRFPHHQRIGTKMIPAATMAFVPGGGGPKRFAR